MFINPIGNRSTGLSGNRSTPVSQTDGSFKEVLQKPLSQSENFIKSQFSRPDPRITENVKFSGTYEDRLEQLKKLNENTDWKSMSDVEKVRTFEDRYRQAFNNDRALFTGLYAEYSSQQHVIYEQYCNEKVKYFGDGNTTGFDNKVTRYIDDNGILKMDSYISSCYREAYYGNMTDEEVRAAIREKYKGTDSMEDKYVILREYYQCGVSKEPDEKLRIAIPKQIFAQIENKYKYSLYGTGMSVSQMPRFSELYMTYAKGVGEAASFRPNWTLIANETMKLFQSLPLGEYNDIQNAMDDFLDEILGNKGE